MKLLPQTLLCLALAVISTNFGLATIDFQQPHALQTQGAAGYPILADLNHDGHLDIVASDAENNELYVFLGTGHATFQRLAPVTGIALPSYVSAADFNNDGNIDLAVSSTLNSRLEILLGNGDGTFQPPLDQGEANYQIAVGDLNGDGIPDLAVRSRSFDLNVFLGNGDGTFRFDTTFPLIMATEAVIADFNRDGKLDLSIPGRVWLGNGDGSFQKPISYAALGLFTVADFNGDGILDVASADYYSGVLYLNIGNGDGTFDLTFQQFLSYTTYSLAAGDLDGDGLADLVAGDSSAGTISVLPGTAQGSLAAPVSSFSGIFTTLGDVDEDGHLDAVSSYGPGLSVLLGKGDDTFNAPRAYLLYQAQQIVSADFNNDGRPDVAVSNGQGTNVNVYLGGAKGFQTPLVSPVGAADYPLAAGDVNHDGNADLATIDSEGEGVHLLLGKGDGTFQPATLIEEPSTASSVLLLADVNHDGNLDLITTSTGPQVALGNGDGTFQKPLLAGIGGYVDTVAVADMNNDGNLDLVAGSNYNRGTAVLLGNGDGTFAPQIRFGGGLSPISVATGDFNRDGNQDIVAVDPTLGVRLFLGRGDGTFQVGAGYRTTSFMPNSVAVADFDGDGNLDFAITSYSSKITVFAGKGDGTFQGPLSFGAPEYTLSIALADFNQDGRIDLAVAGSDSILVLGNASH